MIPDGPVPQLDAVHEALSELHEIRDLLERVLAVDSGEFVTVPWPLLLGVAGKQFDTWETTETNAMHAVQIDNPTANTLEVRFDGSQPSGGNAAARIPAHTGRILVRKFSAISIGVDPATPLVAATPIFVTIYSRPITPAGYPYAP
jgi:hypothetical protein